VRAHTPTPISIAQTLNKAHTPRTHAHKHTNTRTNQRQELIPILSTTNTPTTTLWLQARRQEVAFQGEDVVIFLVVGIPEAQRYHIQIS
jgi:hypothetical protein